MLYAAYCHKKEKYYKPTMTYFSEKFEVCIFKMYVSIMKIPFRKVAQLLFCHSFCCQVNGLAVPRALIKASEGSEYSSALDAHSLKTKENQMKLSYFFAQKLKTWHPLKQDFSPRIREIDSPLKHRPPIKPISRNVLNLPEATLEDLNLRPLVETYVSTIESMCYINIWHTC